MRDIAPEDLEWMPPRVMSGIKATARVAATARALWMTTDDHPLTGLTAMQGFLWDELCAAMDDFGAALADEEWDG